MKIERLLLQDGMQTVPCIQFMPPDPKGAAVVIHGYGGNKEEQLGLAWRVAEAGLITCAIDLRGHGENKMPYDDRIEQDVELAVQHYARFGKVTAIGHSVGGRLSLLSKADFVIGLSPALRKAFSAQTMAMLEKLRSYRVKEIRPNINFETVERLPEWQYNGTKNVKILFGSRDVPEIMEDCIALKEKGVPVVQIDKAFHNDIFLLGDTFSEVTRQIKEWFSIE